MRNFNFIKTQKGFLYHLRKGMPWRRCIYFDSDIYKRLNIRFLDTTQYFRQHNRCFLLKYWMLHGPKHSEKCTGCFWVQGFNMCLFGVCFLLSLNNLTDLACFSLTSYVFNSSSSATRGSPWWKPPSWWSVSSSSLRYFLAWRDLKMKRPSKSTYTRFVQSTMHAVARNNLK